MPKLVIQIPCHDEAESIEETIAELPRVVDGFDEVEVIVVDDGSTDGTAEVALRAGANAVVRSAQREGLARAFCRGIDAALARGADVIVNTDGDNQYVAACIPDLVRPIVDGRAEIVVGDRAPADVAHFSPSKRGLQRVGSWVVSLAAGSHIPDAASGFRAISRHAALRLFVHGDFTYTHEMLIHAVRGRIAVAHVPVEVRRTRRRSRLAGSMFGYVGTSAVSIFRAYAMYSPLRVFVTIGGVLTLGGFAVCARFLWFYLENGGAGHVQSLLLGVLLLVLGFGTAMLGLLADVIAGNRRLLEELLRRVRTLELAQHQDRAMSDTRDATTSPADIAVARKAARSRRAAVGDPSS